MEFDLPVIIGAAMLAWAIYREHFFHPEGIRRKNPPRARLNPRYDCPRGTNCKILAVEMLGEDISRIDLETPGGEQFSEKRHRMELDCDIFQVAAGHDAPRIFAREKPMAQEPEQPEQILQPRTEKKETNNTEYVCPTCQKSCKSYPGLVNHMRQAHKK